MNDPARLPWARSLRLRLLVATLAALAVALLLAGLLLAGLFKDHVMRQFSQTLTAQLDQVTARLEFDASGQPQIDPQMLSDPRWSRPYSGLYWQLDGVPATPAAAAAAGAAGAGGAVGGPALQRGVLRSRSLWDATLVLPADELADGVVHVHELRGPDGAPLLVVERTVRPEAAQARPWRLVVGADLRETVAAVARFNRVLAASLAALLVLLCAAALAQVAIGLAPLRALQRALADVHGGQAARLHGAFPSEVQPLITDFNAVLDRNAEVVTRSRTQAGNLAHAIKTPLAALQQAAAAVLQQAPTVTPAPQPITAAAPPHEPPPAGTPAAACNAAELAALVAEQVAVARRQVDWHLARARAAAAQGLPGARVALQPVASGLQRVLQRVHAERGLALDCSALPPELAFAGEVQDLQEMMGNLLDNACKWARHRVQVSARTADTGEGRRLQICIDDDGPGIAAEQRAAVLARGARLDESVPGSGLGLAIVHELAGLYGGSLHLLVSPLGGLRAQLELPAG